MTREDTEPKRGSKKYRKRDRERDKLRAVRIQRNRRKNLRAALPEGTNVEDIELDLAYKFLTAVKDKIGDD